LGEAWSYKDRQLKEKGQITRSAGKVGLLTLLSRVLGLVRDAVVAASFTKRSTDAFFVAFTIPNVLRRLLAEGTLTVAFIPVFTDYREQKGEGEARLMLANMQGAAMLMLALVVAVGMLGAPWVVRLFALGFADDPGKMDLSVLLTRLMFPFLWTVGMTALAMGVLNTLRHFSAPAVAPVVLNVFIIGTVLLGADQARRLGLPAITALGCGVVLGGVAQLLMQQPFISRLGLLVRPRLGLTHPGVLRVGKLMLPAVFGLAIYEINVVLARQFSSFLQEGSVSYLYYAQRLVEFPMGIFAVAMATVTMPSLSSRASAGDTEGLKETYRYALRVVFFIILPASAGLAALALPLTSVLFQRGQFSHPMAVQTALTLMGFLAGLWAGAGVKQTVPVFYAMQDTRTPVKVAAVALLAYSVTALLLFQRLGTLGLALAVSASSLINFTLLVLILRRRLGLLGLRKVTVSVLKAGLAAACCGAGAWAVARAGDWTLGGAAAKNYALLLAAVLAGVAIYLALCKLLRIRELGELARAFRSRR
jgi:putative peptidoglycan lipid II flippase